MQTVLTVDKLNVFYDDIQVLLDVSLNVYMNEIVVIIGANAAGKSTLLSAISGLLDKKNGEIFFRDKRIDKLHANEIAEEGITMVPEGRRLFSFMTVKENLLMGAYIRKARPTIKSRMEEIYSLLPILKERRNQLAGSLSGGEQQMLAIGRALMANPLLIMLDEPSLGLSPIMVDKIFDIIQAIKNQGYTVLLVEQNVQHALEISNRAYVIENGRIVIEGEGNTLSKDDRLRNAYMGI